MKFSLIKNDRSTYKDEIILAVMILCCVGIGLFFIVARPTFGMIRQNSIVMFGVLIFLFGVMFIPGLIYRLFTNDADEDKT